MESQIPVNLEPHSDHRLCDHWGMKLGIDNDGNPFTVKALEGFLQAARAIGADDETPVYLPGLNDDELYIDF